MSRDATFAKLVGLLRPYAPRLVLKSDTPTNFYLEEATTAGKARMFAAVQRKTSYVALHLYPVYVRPDLLADLDPGLLGRMQGKSCFNFKNEAQVPEAELASLIRSAFATLG